MGKDRRRSPPSVEYSQWVSQWSHLRVKPTEMQYERAREFIRNLDAAAEELMRSAAMRIKMAPADVRKFGDLMFILAGKQAALATQIKFGPRQRGSAGGKSHAITVKDNADKGWRTFARRVAQNYSDEAVEAGRESPLRAALVDAMQREGKLKLTRPRRKIKLEV
jgi:hypothetical protein